MTNAMRGFGMAITEANAQRVNDVYSKLAAITAADTDEISTAMTKVASLASNANMEFETTSAFLSQIIETTREAPETAGTALKTIIARFSEVKKLYSEGSLMGTDEEGQEINVNKVSEALRTAGINLNEYLTGSKGLDDILIELASKWDSLDIVQQRYLATMAAGSRQQSRFIAMMSDYDRTMELVNAANNSAGASQKQYEKTLESLQTKLTQLKNAWDVFVMDIADNELIKFGIDALTKLLTVINNITGVLPGFSSGLAKIGVLWGGLLGGKKIFNNSEFGNNLAAIIGKVTGNIDSDGSNNDSEKELGKNFISKFINGIKENYDSSTIKKLLFPENLVEQKFKIGGLVDKSLDKGTAEQQERIISNRLVADWKERLDITRDLNDEEEQALKTLITKVVLGKSNLAQNAAQLIIAKDMKTELGRQIQANVKNLVTSQGELTVRQLIATTVKTTASYLKGIVVANAGLIVSIAAVAATIAIIVKLYKDWKKEQYELSATGQLDKLNDKIKSIDASIEKATISLQNFKDILDTVNGTTNPFEGLIKGTDEWRKAVEDANIKAKELVETYPELAEFQTLGENGEITFDTQHINAYGQSFHDVYNAAQGRKTGMEVARTNMGVQQSQLEAQQYFEENLQGQFAVKSIDKNQNLAAYDVQQQLAEQLFDQALTTKEQLALLEKTVVNTFSKEFKTDGKIDYQKILNGYQKYWESLRQADRAAQSAIIQNVSSLTTNSNLQGDTLSAFQNIVTNRYNQLEQAAINATTDRYHQENLSLGELQTRYANSVGYQNYEEYLNDENQSNEDINDEEQLINALASNPHYNGLEQSLNNIENTITNLSPQGQDLLTQVAGNKEGKYVKDETLSLFDKELADGSIDERELASVNNIMANQYGTEEWNSIRGTMGGTYQFAQAINQGYQAQEAGQNNQEYGVNNEPAQIDQITQTAQDNEYDVEVLKQKAEAYYDQNKALTEGLTLLDSYQAMYDQMRADRGLDNIIKTYDDWNDALKELIKNGKNVNKINSQQLEDINELKTNTADLLAVNEEDISSDFLADHQKELDEIANGQNTEANVQSMYDDLGQDYIMNLRAEADDASVQQAFDELNQFVLDSPELDDLEVGATLDNGPFLDSLNKMIQSTGMTVDQVQEYLSKAGYDAEVEEVEVEGTATGQQENYSLIPTGEITTTTSTQLSPKQKGEKGAVSQQFKSTTKPTGSISFDYKNDGDTPTENTTRTKVPAVKFLTKKGGSGFGGNVGVKKGKTSSGGKSPGGSKKSKSKSNHASQRGSGSRFKRPFYAQQKNNDSAVEKAQQTLVKSQEKVNRALQDGVKSATNIKEIFKQQNKALVDQIKLIKQGNNFRDKLGNTDVLKMDPKKQRDLFQKRILGELYNSETLNKVTLIKNKKGNKIRLKNNEDIGRERLVKVGKNESGDYNRYGKYVGEGKGNYRIDTNGKGFAINRNYQDIYYKDLKVKLNNTKKGAKEYGVMDFLTFDEETNRWKLNQKRFDALEKSNDPRAEKVGSAVTEVLEKLNGNLKEIEDAEEQITNLIYEAVDGFNSLEDASLEMQGRIRDAIISSRQAMIDQLSSEYEMLDQYNSEVLNGLQDVISEQRKERERENQRQDINEKQQRLAYLKRDTSGANAVEIKQLEEELSDDMQNFSDNLIDDQIERLNKNAEDASQQRARQIETMTKQLEIDQANGKITAAILRYLSDAIKNPSDPKELMSLLAEAEDWDQLTPEEYAKKQAEFFDSLDATVLHDQLMGLSQKDFRDYFGYSEVTTEAQEAIDNLYSRIHNVYGDKEDLPTETTDVNSGGGETPTGNVGDLGEQYGNVDSKPSEEPDEPNPPSALKWDNYKDLSKKDWKALSTDIRTQLAQQFPARFLAKNGGVYTNYGTDDAKKLYDAFKASTRKATKTGLTNFLTQDQNITQDKLSSPYYVAFMKRLEEFGYKKDQDAKKLFKDYTFKYKTGGLADFTGPAWLDGTKSRPEIVLNQQDSQNFLQLKDILRDFSKGGKLSDSISNEVHYDIVINADIASDYDVDQMAARIKQQILQNSNYRNVNAISHMR